MKKKKVLYSLATLALIAGVIGFATEIRPTQKEVPQMSVEASTIPTETSAVKKKACGCCAERLARLQEQIRKARQRSRAAQQAAATEESLQQQESRASDTP